MLNRLKKSIDVWQRATTESLVCIGAGFWDAASPGLLFRSALLCIVPAVMWALVYYHYSEVMKAAFIGLSLIGAFGLVLAGFQGFISLSGAAGGNSASVTSINGIQSLLSCVQALLLVAAILAALYVLIYLFLVFTTVRLATPLIVLPSAKSRVSRRLRPATLSAPDNMGSACNTSWRKTLTTVLLLCIPALAGLMIVAGFCYLNVRLIYATVARDTENPGQLFSSLRWRWRPLLIIGVFLMLLLAIPLLNLLVPALMCTAVLNLAYRDNIGRLSLPDQAK